MIIEYDEDLGTNQLKRESESGGVYFVRCNVGTSNYKLKIHEM